MQTSRDFSRNVADLSIPSLRYIQTPPDCELSYEFWAAALDVFVDSGYDRDAGFTAAYGA